MIVTLQRIKAQGIHVFPLYKSQNKLSSISGVTQLDQTGNKYVFS
jgi:hypothetical protein